MLYPVATPGDRDNPDIFEHAPKDPTLVVVESRPQQNRDEVRE